MRKAVAAVALAIPLITVALLVSACATDASAGPPVSDGLLRDAEAYAEDQGIPLDEAIRQLRLQDPVGELNAVLQEREGDVFGGLWIQHEPEYGVIVLVTQDQARIQRRYVAGGPLEGEVEIREAEATLEELEAAQTATMRILGEVGSRADSGIKVQENCVSVFVADPEGLQEKLDAAGAALPEHVCIEVTGPYAEAPPLDPPPGVVFPRQHPPEGLRAEMEALLIGELLEEDGCLRVGEAGESHLVIWPYDYTVTAAEDGKLQVRDGSGNVVARVGDIMRIGGGQVPKAEDATPTDIPARCGGPYWLASSEVSSVNLEELPDHETIAPLLRELEAQGYTMRGPEESEAVFLAPEPGIAYRLGERSWLHLHLFPNEQVAQVRADSIPAELPNVIIEWVAPPHFYRCGRVIALYLGSDEDVRQVLEQQCDPIGGAQWE
jgi:hypothetical protein